MIKNYYHILGVSPNAPASEIKAAYKRLALKYHPDKNPGNERAEEQFKLVNEAYQVLSNPRRRATFDLQRQYEQRQRQPQAYSDPRYHQTRRPAGYRERHYRQRAQRPKRFSKKDFQIVVGVVLAALLLVLLLKLGWDQYAYRRALEQAKEAEQTANWQQAHDYYSEVLDYNPDLEEVRVKRATLRQSHLNDAQGAIADFSWVLRKSPSPKPGWYAARGKSHLVLRHYQQAIEDFNTALFLAPVMVQVYRERAVAYLQSEENWPAAVADLSYYLSSEAVTPTEKTEAYLYRAYAFYRLEQMNSAWQDTEHALAQDSMNGKAFYLQALIARAQKGQELTCELLAKAAQFGFKNAAAEMEYHCDSL